MGRCRLRVSFLDGRANHVQDVEGGRGSDGPEDIVSGWKQAGGLWVAGMISGQREFVPWHRVSAVSEEAVAAMPAVGQHPADAVARGGAVPYYEAGAVLGMELDPHKLYREERHRCCGCLDDAEIGEMKFCPQCGKPAWDTHWKAIPQWDASDPGRLTLAGLPVITTAAPDTPGLERTPLGRLAIRQGVRLFVGEYVARTDMTSQARRQDAAGLDAARGRLQGTLEPLGLWDQAKWGLWAVLNRVG